MPEHRVLLVSHDTGLVCFLLGIDTPENLDIYHSRGDIFENMVVANFIKNRYNMGKEPNIFFYKDKSKIEVDIFEQTQFKYNAIEIKSSKIFHSGFFANLNYVKNLLNEDIVSMSVIFDGDISIPSQFGGTKNFRSL
ncbi:MAG: DUF4143 domain-containing protein [Bacteroidales bacterium]|jgi:hypothetical protein|nr:DUF4143 domain-containing protein [Bacteroidales bacterium]